MLKTNVYSLTALVKYFFHNSKMKFISLRYRVMCSMYGAQQVVNRLATTSMALIFLLHFHSNSFISEKIQVDVKSWFNLENV